MKLMSCDSGAIMYSIHTGHSYKESRMPDILPTGVRYVVEEHVTDTMTYWEHFFETEDGELIALLKMKYGNIVTLEELLATCSERG